MERHLVMIEGGCFFKGQFWYVELRFLDRKRCNGGVFAGHDHDMIILVLIKNIAWIWSGDWCGCLRRID